MILYVLVALFPLLVGTFYDMRISRCASGEEIKTKKYINKRWWWLFLAALPMFVLIALRAPAIGNDTNGYLTYFEQIVKTPLNKIFIINEATQQFEPGFVIFEKLLTYITHSSKVYQVIYSMIYLVSIVTFANQLEKHSFSFLYFFATLGTYTFMFTGVRQCLAMCLCLLSYPFVKKRKLFLFLLMVLLAFTFHKSAILFIAAYFIYNRKISWINSIIYLVFGVLAYIYIDVLQEWFNNTLDYDYAVEETGNGIIFFALITIITVFSFFTILIYRKKTYESAGLLNIGVITFVLWMLRLVTRVAERPSFYFMFFSAAMLCYGLDAPENGKERILFKVLAYSACMLLLIYRLLTSHATLVPYVPFF